MIDYRVYWNWCIKTFTSKALMGLMLSFAIYSQAEHEPFFHTAWNRMDVLQKGPGLAVYVPVSFHKMEDILGLMIPSKANLSVAADLKDGEPGGNSFVLKFIRLHFLFCRQLGLHALVCCTFSQQTDPKPLDVRGLLYANF